MKTQTIEEIRFRLWKIVQKVFTPKFVRRYEFIAQNPPLFKVIETYHEDTLDFIREISMCLDHPQEIDRLISAASDCVIFTTYIKYFTATNTLQRADQQTVLLVSKSDSEFFRFILNDYLAQQER